MSRVLYVWAEGTEEIEGFLIRGVGPFLAGPPSGSRRKIVEVEVNENSASMHAAMATRFGDRVAERIRSAMQREAEGE